jgi:hypothetical protein
MLVAQRQIQNGGCPALYGTPVFEFKLSWTVNLFDVDQNG